MGAKCLLSRFALAFRISDEGLCLPIGEYVEVSPLPTVISR